MSLTFPRYCHDYTQALAAADLALPLIILLAGQVVLMFIFTYFVVFNIMGRDYDAAVLAQVLAVLVWAQRQMQWKYAGNLRKIRTVR